MSEWFRDFDRQWSASGHSTIETHISMVFLAPERVYKVKKPVDLGFLDFSTPELRRSCCESEVQLNSRLAPGVYLGVVPVTRSPEGTYAFGGAGVRVDWAVEMVRLDESNRADVLLREGRVERDEIETIAVTLARFHQAARCDEETSKYGSHERVRANVEENFEQTVDTIGLYLAPHQVHEVEAWQLDFLGRHRESFDRRVLDERIRDGHGDLRLEHIYLDESHGVRIIDCIEFNERFRYADVAADIAFLAMDLTASGRVDLAEAFLALYSREAGDFDLYSVVDFYESYRAFVRGKVSGILAGERAASVELRERAAADARRFFLLSLASERRSLLDPTLIAVGGIIACGKSTVAQAVADQLAAPVIATDRARKQLMGLAPEEPVHEEAFSGAYSPEASSKVYDEVLRRAEIVLRSGRSVLLDASFRSRVERQQAKALAEGLGVPFRFVECLAPDAVCRERLAERARRAQVSDGRLEIFDDFVARWEPVEELDVAEHVRLDTTRPLWASLEILRRSIPSWPVGV